MGSIPAQLSALARNALSWRCSSSLHTSAVLQTSTQSVCSVLLQDATAHTSSDARLSDCVHQTVVSSFHFGHSSHHEHDEPVYHTCNQVFLPRSATTPSVSCSSASTVSCLVDTSRQHRQSLQSTLWSTPSLRHLQPVLLRLHAAPSHIRHISSAVSCWRPPQSNQDTPHARGPMPRPMYQTPPLQHGRGVGNPQHVSEQSSSQAPYSERQRPPFQRSSPPHTRQPGESRIATCVTAAHNNGGLRAHVVRSHQVVAIQSSTSTLQSLSTQYLSCGQKAHITEDLYSSRRGSLSAVTYTACHKLSYWVELAADMMTRSPRYT